MTRQKLLVVVLLVLALVVAYLLLGTGNIRGRVVDAEGEPVSTAMVQVAGNSILTDQDGQYLVPNVRPGRYTLSVHKEGYGGLTTEVTVRFGQTTQADVSLVPSP